MTKKQSALPIATDCNGCGVCCFHMGYPAFILPRDPIQSEEEFRDPAVRELLKQGWTREELTNGVRGEEHWHKLPEDLRNEWLEFVEIYQRDGELDGPCFWLDTTTRQCKHHNHRPNVCRDFEIGSKLCREWRDHYRSEIVGQER